MGWHSDRQQKLDSITRRHYWRRTDVGLGRERSATEMRDECPNAYEYKRFMILPGMC